MVSGVVAPGAIPSGTRIAYVLGRRSDKSQPRPLENLAFRARFDLNLEIARAGGQLALKELPIAIDSTPLRVRGSVGGSLYRSARAAGVPAKLVEQYIKTMATRVGVSRLGSGEFELIAERQSAATGEVKYGNLLYGGLYQGKSKTQLVRWEQAGKTQWLDGTGRGEQRGSASMPVFGRLTSSYGMRRHPVLGYARMHKGLDLAAPQGTPIRAAMDGVVASAGRAGGYGNFVKLMHSAGLATGYGHMSRIAVRAGARVSRGQVIGYVGSTGISTGPHLHYEVWRNGVAINPGRVSFSSVQQLAGADLREFKARLNRLLSVPVGGGGRGK
jgi:murein DD-endopeptidase MepM/ murein hydrolase activator NlpD